EAGKRDFVLVDVREPAEYEINRIPGAVLIPKGDFLNGSALEQLPDDKQVVLHCKTGVRSAECLAIVKGAGYGDAVHVGGGVVAWVNQIDPSQPAYWRELVHSRRRRSVDNRLRVVGYLAASVDSGESSRNSPENPLRRVFPPA